VANLFSTYEVSKEAFRGGVPVELDGATFRVRYAGAENMQYQTALGVAALKHRDLFADVEGNASRLAELEPEITAAAMFETVLLGWENVSGRDGAPLEFTRENWLDLALSCPRVLMTIRHAAENFAAYRAKRVEEAAENLGKLPSGPGSGELSSPDCLPSESPESELGFLNNAP
jgi:hypothetical protein